MDPEAEYLTQHMNPVKGGRSDTAAGKFEPVTFCPGYMRGLSFQGDYAIVGLSKQRENRTFSGLALDDALQTRAAASR